MKSKGADELARLENAADVAALRKAREEISRDGTVPWEKLKAELRLGRSRWISKKREPTGHR